MKNIDVVILAAGVGSRLRPITERIPKCLVQVAGKPILEHLLALFSQIDNQIDLRVYVVGGYRANAVEKFIQTLTLAFPVEIIVNDDYETTNNMYSLALVFPYLSKNGDLIIVNGDCVYEQAIVHELLNAPSNLILVDSSVYCRESMKVQIVEGCIKSIAKTIGPGDNVFTSIDMYRFSGNTKAIFMNIVNRYVRNQQLNHWTEVAIEEMLQQEGVCVKTCDIAGKKWVEIDTVEDLNRSQTLW